MIRIATPDDLEIITTLFRDTIQHVNTKDYNEEQIKVWSSRFKAFDKWKMRIREHHFLLSENDGQLEGMCSMTKDGYLDVFYISKDHQGKGVARELYDQIESWAVKNKLKQIDSDVSITARPFFEHMGFMVTRDQTVYIDSVALNNYHMVKTLNPA